MNYGAASLLSARRHHPLPLPGTGERNTATPAKVMKEQEVERVEGKNI